LRQESPEEVGEGESGREGDVWSELDGEGQGFWRNVCGSDAGGVQWYGSGENDGSGNNRRI
jgi:hypothetical protein